MTASNHPVIMSSMIAATIFVGAAAPHSDKHSITFSWEWLRDEPKSYRDL
jgi:hypothetical protein